MCRRNLIILWLTLLATACAPQLPQNESEAPDDEASAVALSERVDAIISGDPIHPEGAGFVRLRSKKYVCSGTLITNDWVLTAAHCFTTDDLWSPRYTVVNMGSQTAEADYIEIHPYVTLPVRRYGGPDVALVHLKRGMQVWNAPFDLKTPVYVGNPSLLVGKNVTCYGYGNNTLTGGYGTLRSAIVKVSSASYYISTLANERGQNPFEGDSGGACFYMTPSGKQLAMVISQAADDASYHEGVPPSTFMPWLMQRIYGVPQFSNAWPALLPDNKSESVTWDPCSGQCFAYNASYNFENGFDYGTLAGQRVTGVGSMTGRACGAVSVQVQTDGTRQSVGFDNVVARCDAAVHCHGTTCATGLAPLPNHMHASASWNPCPNNCFTWLMQPDLEPNYDFAYLGGLAVSGTDTRSGLSCDPLTLSVTTDGSVASQGMIVYGTCSQ